eukprot:2885999-Prymnesium_polylepis.1
MLGVKFDSRTFWLIQDAAPHRAAMKRYLSASAAEPEARIAGQLSSRPAALKRGKGELIDVLE